MTVRYATGWYNWAKNFGAAIDSDVGKRAEFAPFALTLDRRANTLPDLLCVHVVVLLRDASGQCRLLLAQRSEQVAHDPGTWSCSIEEQYRPAWNYGGGHPEPPDQSIHGCAARGIREELGEEISNDSHIQTHAYFVQATTLQSAFLALAELRIHDFQEVVTGLRVAVDYAEHQSVVAVPFDLVTVQRLLTSPQLALGDLAAEAIWLKGGPERIRKFGWHPSSKLRLALALWWLLSSR
jgi:hypothetical protein